MIYTENYNIEEIFFEPEKDHSLPESNTFLDWLEMSKKDSFTRFHKIKHQQDLISSFIKTGPKVQPVKAALNSIDTDLAEDIARKKKGEQANLIVSETLAKIYYEQQKYNLAIETYKKLGLVYPEKKSYFASLIKEIEKESEN